MKRSLLILISVASLSVYACSDNSGKAGNEQGKQETAVAEAGSGNEKSGQAEQGATASGGGSEATVVDKPVYLTNETFKQLVFNYEKNPDQWVFEGDKPCIIDFYADWCKPCKLVAPILDELAKEYAGKIIIYKVNTDQERELSAVFGIRSIPSVLFCPAQGQPQMTQGALPKETFVQVINEFLLPKEAAAVKQ